MKENQLLPEQAYARSRNGQGEYESVAHHLVRAGELCAQFAGEFGCTEAGKTLGMLHDLGKYGGPFQDVLRRKRIHVDHAGPGAAAVYNVYGGKSKAKLLAAVIAAHHSQLDNAVFNYLTGLLLGEPGLYSPKGDLPALIGAEELSAALKRMTEETGFTPAQISVPRWKESENQDLSYMLLARMLLSALVDADYSSSAEHFEPDYLLTHTGAELDPADALEQVKALREEKRKNSRAASGINAIRDRLFDDCLQAAEAPPGIFTLTAPTGTGKTLSLFAFAAQHALKYRKRRIILILPYLTLAEQNAEEYRKLVPELMESHSASELDERTRLLSERWAAPCVVTTTVGFFEPLFASRPSECRRLHQIADSVIVLDEAQSLPSGLLDATLQCMKQLCDQYGCTVLFSTATQPSFQYRPGLNWHPTEIVKAPQQMFAATRRVTYHWRTEKPVAWEAIADELAEHDQGCVIVNLRRHARKLCQLLAARRPEEEAFYISTDLCLEHRRAVLQEVRDRLNSGRPCRLVSTQCIEAGVDVSFPVLYRALAPLESIIQAAGRCNRNGDGPDGQVTVFLPQDTGRLYPDAHYENAANCVINMLDKGPIDCSDLKVIDEYYRRLYQKFSCDIPELRSAIENRDFAAVESAYQIIGSQGVNVIVPYAPERELFERLRTRADTEGLTNGLMKEARPLVVTSYRRKEVDSLCVPIPMRLPDGKPANSTGWYLLGDPSHYDGQLGFSLEKSEYDGIC